MAEKEYIERDAAINAVFEAIADGRAVFPALNNLPAADVRPVVRGEWLRTPTFWAYCSVCGEEPPEETNITTNYCPNCGADMRPKEGE